MTKVKVQIDGMNWEMVAVGYGEWSDEIEDNYTLYFREFFEDMPITVAALESAGVDISETQMIGQRVID